jgi:transposase
MSEHDRLEFWTRALNLPDFRVVHETRTTADGPVCFTVRPTVQCGVCPHCHKPTDYVNRTTESDRVKDLPLGTQPVELIVRTLQFYCQDCDCYFTPHYRAFAPGAHATERFLQQAAKLIRFSDIQNAALFFGVPATTLARWYYAYTERLAQHPPAEVKPITHLGIDELSQKKSTGSSSWC